MRMWDLLSHIHKSQGNHPGSLYGLKLLTGMQTLLCFKCLFSPALQTDTIMWIFYLYIFVCRHIQSVCIMHPCKCSCTYAWNVTRNTTFHFKSCSLTCCPLSLSNEKRLERLTLRVAREVKGKPPSQVSCKNTFMRITSAVSLGGANETWYWIYLVCKALCFIMQNLIPHVWHF